MALQDSITPQEIIKPAVTLVVDSIMFRFGLADQYAFATCSLLDVDGKVAKTETVNLTELELENWGSDDAELVAIIKTKLGL